MDWTSTLPDAIDQLVLLAQQAEELEGVDVRDGPALGDQAATTVVYIGWTGGDSDSDAETQVGADGLAGDRDLEESVIRCTAVARIGNGTISAARRAAYDLVSGVGAVIARNRNLNGTVMRAEIGSHTLTQQETAKGTHVAVIFEVTYTAFTTR